jgi:hypothetical protein
MEFSYKVTESEYLNALKLRISAGRSRVVKTVVFWVFVLICLMLLLSIVQKTSRIDNMARESSTAQTDDAQTEPAATQSTSHLTTNVALFAGVWIVVFTLLRLAPGRRARRLYRDDPQMQGQFKVNVNSQSISTENSAGSSSTCAWNIYDYWREGRDVIILVFRSGTYFILGLSGLSETQRAELRGILTAALPRK